jgi:2-polyprenyl-3-methyl-5-hydroxy-6-metoxy-1,4-benzoquinol methylase
LGIETKFFGDYAEGYAYQGPIELTIRQIPNVDMFICSETLEHLDNPDKVLAQLRVKAKHLVLSTPIDEADDNNPEHYWSWGTEDIEEMLETADWSKRSLSELRVTGHHYNYQIWLCS